MNRTNRHWAVRPSLIAEYDEALPAGVPRSRAIDMAVERCYRDQSRLVRAFERRMSGDAVEPEATHRYAFSVSVSTASRLELLAQQADLPIELVLRLVLESHLWDLRNKEARPFPLTA